MPQFIISGCKPLRGEVKISGSKNAALPILAATLLTNQRCEIKNVPDIEDIHTMLALLKSLGSEVSFSNNTVSIQTKRINQKTLAHDLACKMRASVLLLGPLLARTGEARLSYPGGCVLGARSIDTHLNILLQLGVKEMPSSRDKIFLKGFPHYGEVILPEFSVTATENAIMAASLSKGQTIIRLAAEEPHVQDLCRFLKTMGVQLEGIGTHNISINGAKRLRGVSYAITPDYLEAGTFVIATLVTHGEVVVKNIIPHDLDVFWNLLGEMGISFELNKNSVKIHPISSWKACTRLQTNVFPGFPTDLQPPFAVLLAHAKGQSKVHETLFEGRFNYFPELIKMGAKIEKLNPHEAIITGVSKLRGERIKSWDIRAGAAMIIAALAAKGRTTVSDIQYIDRGYERFDEKLRRLGADIERLD